MEVIKMIIDESIQKKYWVHIKNRYGVEIEQTPEIDLKYLNNFLDQIKKHEDKKTKLMKGLVTNLAIYLELDDFVDINVYEWRRTCKPIIKTAELLVNILNKQRFNREKDLDTITNETKTNYNNIGAWDHYTR
jgi:hypothetical protein